MAAEWRWKAMFALVLLGFVLGGICGGILGGRFVHQHHAELARQSVPAEAATTVHVLQQLRDDDIQGAIELLETQLGGQLLTLHAEAFSMSKADPDLAGMVLHLKRYRTQHPPDENWPGRDLEQALFDWAAAHAPIDPN